MSEFFIGRQPILDQNLNLYAYELLFRDGHGNLCHESVDHDTATSQVIINAFTEIGLDKLVGKQLAFVNTPYKFICDPNLLPMQPDRVVLEILENMEIDEHSLEGIKLLHARGFGIALDDFVYHPDYDDVFPFVSIVKLDITQIDRSQWQTQIDALRQKGCKILAEKVETQEEYDFLKTLNVDFFQGYFFAKPKVVSGKRIAPNKLILLQLLKEVNNPNADIDVLQDLISKDVGISVKALNYVNSPASGLLRKVDSIREAIVYLGRATIKNWVTLIAMSSVEDKPDVLMTTGLVRAKFCELLAEKAGFEEKDAFFTVGLFSILDAILDVPLEDTLEAMAITPDMHDALIKHSGKKGKALRCVTDMEFGLVDDKPLFKLDEATVSDLYLDAMEWADNATQNLG